MERIAQWVTDSLQRWNANMKMFLRDLPQLPITQFYSYMWENDKWLLVKSLLVNYLLPLVLELLPWWLSRNKLAIKIRKARVGINYSMQTNLEFNRHLVKKFIILNFLYTLINTIVQFWKDRVALEHKFAVRRLVLGRILHADIEAFDDLKEKTTERFADIGRSLAFFNFTVPEIISSFYKLFLEGRELWKHRARIDELALLFPFAVYILRLSTSWLHSRLMNEFTDSIIKKKKKERNLKIREFISNLIDGLADIQINNLQQTQLDHLDSLIEEEQAINVGWTCFMDRMFQAIKKQDSIEFVGEAYIIHQIMRRKNIEFDKYLIVQGDMDSTLHTVQQLVKLWGVIQKEYERQKKVKDIVNIPNWKEEEQATIPIEEFRELTIRGLRFSYHRSQIPVIDFDDEEMVFESGKCYGIVGKNMAGKSTLAHLICKLYDPQEGEMLLNGIPYEHVDRQSLRELISYASQSPFLFPGTIRDNIKIGNPNATDDEVLNAALSSGVLAFSTTGPLGSPPRPQRKIHSVVEMSKMIRERFNQQEKAESFSDQEIEPEEILLPSPDFPAPLRRHTRNRSFDMTCDFSPARLTRSVSMTDLRDIETLHTILDTEVSARGKNMSGGLCQSVALARVYVRPQARIIILDESIGHMDASKKRSVIFPYLFDFIERNNMTLIMISHDMHDIKDLDYIYVMEEGCVVNQGTHQELYRKNAFAYMELNDDFPPPNIDLI